MIRRFIYNFRYFSFFILFIALLNGCEPNDETTSETVPPDMHNSMIAVDWVGTYHGVVPCADCEGVDTKITLTGELNYQAERIYLGKSDQIFKSEGSFNWSEDGSRIQLNDLNPSHAPGAYQVGENRLFQLDMDGNRIEGNLADQYVLTKVIDNLNGLQWRLMDLGSTSVTLNNGALRSPYLHFLNDENKVSGHGGCNRFNGRYMIKSENRISFTDIASTKMACDQMETENKFFNALERADNYTLNHDTLSIYRDDQINLVRFLLFDE